MSRSIYNVDSRYLLGIVLLAIAAAGRVVFVHDIISDDNNWLRSIYSTDGLRAFLDTGFFEMRRPVLGSYLYSLFWLHKHTEWFFTAWHALNLLTVIATPVVLYLFMRSFLNGNRVLALFISIAFVAFPLDHTLAYASANNYRVGLLCGLLSLYLTDRHLTNRTASPLQLALSLAALATGTYVFIEALVALELGRLLVISRRLDDRSGNKGSALILPTLRAWTPYALLLLPLVLYKLGYKPYGIYEGLYRLDPLALVDLQSNLVTFAHFLFFPWFIFASQLDVARLPSILSGLAAALSVWFVLPNIVVAKQDALTSPASGASTGWRDIWKGVWRKYRIVPILGVLFLVPATLLFQLAGRPVKWGLYSTHAVLAQVGYSILLGFLFYLLFLTWRNMPTRRWAIRAAIPLVLGTGVFFANVNLDIYLQTMEAKNRFWQSFTQRFTTLPEKADFVFDIRIGSLYIDGPHYYYEYEFPLNLLYARSDQPHEFQRYRVYTSRELLHTLRRAGLSVENLREGYLERKTWHGTDTINPWKFIVVQYRNNVLRVNREILDANPDTPYRALLDKPFPALPVPAVSYPLRGKQPGFETNNPR